MRSDATRNRRRVLEAARALVARDGAEVRMDDIAAAAGVAVGTLYRHFGTKEALVAAVVDDSTARIAEQAQQSLDAVRDGADAWAELERLVRTVAERYEQDRALKAAASQLGAPPGADAPPEGDSPAARAAAGVEQLLVLAQRSGQLRADVTLDDLVVLLAQVPDGSPDLRERYLRVVLRGLRP